MTFTLIQYLHLTFDSSSAEFGPAWVELAVLTTKIRKCSILTFGLTLAWQVTFSEKNEVCFRTVSLTPEAATSLQCFHAPVGVFIYQGTSSVEKRNGPQCARHIRHNKREGLRVYVFSSLIESMRAKRDTHHIKAAKQSTPPSWPQITPTIPPSCPQITPTIPPSCPQITLTTINTLSILVLHLRT